MKVKLSLLLVIVALIVITAYAQTGVAGKWVGELSAKDGHGVSQPITVELKVEGETLTGTVAEGALEARPIQGGTVDGANVTFRTIRNFGGSDINVNWKGELKGEDLTLTREIGPAPAEAGGGRGGGRGGAGAAGGGGRGGARGAAAGAQRGAAAAPAAGEVPPVPAPDQPAAADAGAARGGRGGAAAGGAQRGGAARGAAAPPAAGAAGQGAGGGRGAAAAPAGPTVTLTLHRAR